jgi:hypothetical protein
MTMRLIAATLLAVLLVAEPAAAKKNDDMPPGTVSRIQDERIKESSGLAASSRHSDLAYTVNDRGNDPALYAVQISTGQVVGVTDISNLGFEDTESIAVDDEGTVWIGDLGDNDHQRDNISIVSFPEPGPGNHELASAEQYRVKLPDGPFDVEGMLVHPRDGRVFLVSKNREGLGKIYRLPELTPGATATAEDLDVAAPQMVTDATFTHDGRRALLRTEDDVWVYDTTSWQPVTRVETPKLQQGESITVELGDQTMLLGSEGKNSPLIRLPLPDREAGSGPIPLEESSSHGPDTSLATIGIAVAGVMVLVGIGLQRRLRADSGGRTA